MTDGPLLYAGDEDVAIRASADFPLICPRDQKLAAGDDGQFLPGDRWTLISTSADFQTFGLKPGHVVQLTQPMSAFKPPGETFAVELVAGNAILLRRKGQGSRIGQPPAPAAGLAQVEFSATTLEPQIRSVCDELDRRYGIADVLAGRRHCEGFDVRDVREATVLAVLYRQYLELSRGPEGRGDTYASKAQLYRDELEALLARTFVRWVTTTGDGAGSASPGGFGTRLSR